MVDWIEILKTQVAKSNITQVAKNIGYSRSAVSLALSGKYDGSTDNLRDAVLEAYANDQDCPFLGQTISKQECAEFALRSIPQSNASALKHWRACQSCPNNHRIHQKGYAHA